MVVDPVAAEKTPSAAVAPVPEGAELRDVRPQMGVVEVREHRLNGELSVLPYSEWADSFRRQALGIEFSQMWVVRHVHETETILLQAELVAFGDPWKHSSAGMAPV